jgi:hypothetical protein
MLKLTITTGKKKRNSFNKNHCKKIKINYYNKNKKTHVKLIIITKIIIRKCVKQS